MIAELNIRPDEVALHYESAHHRYLKIQAISECNL